MSTLKYLNLGCGTHFNPQWVNIDFVKTADGVIAHNLLNGIPFDDNMFDVVYHSHVLEHFSKNEAIQFIEECYRVLKPGGIIRIALPDLEQIIANYLRLLNAGKTDIDNEAIRADYEWIMTEMYDQTVRNNNGGHMLKYLTKEILINEEFIFSRIGHEGRMIRKGFVDARNNHQEPVKISAIEKIWGKIKRNAAPKNYRKIILKTFFKKEYQLMQLTQFRQSGEIHQWMYDIYSAGNLLRDAGFKNITQMDFDKSSIPDWRSFELDEIDKVVRKPDSLFVEAFK
jgi:predicted SAM-dependent methyltransferase